MADISITAANVVRVSGEQVSGVAGATITAGQPVYLDSTTSTYLLSDANASGKDAVSGIALNGAAAGQPLVVAKSGSVLTIGATVVVGTIYVLSATAGGICPASDLATGHKTTVLGVATTAARLQLNIFASGVAVP